MNLILGGGDIGKTTILEAVTLLLSPTNATVVSEFDYWQRDTDTEFCIEAVMALPDDAEINTQKNLNWPWHWNGSDAELPAAGADGEDDPVYRVRVRGTAELELAWEIVQPGDQVDHAATGETESAPEGREKEWKSHGRQWFKSEAGGTELGRKMFSLGAWPALAPELLVLVNAALEAAEIEPVRDLVP